MSTVKGIIVLSVVVANTLFWVPILVLFSLIKFVLPLAVVRTYLSKILVWMANNWIWLNTKIHLLMHGNKLQLSGIDDLTVSDWYLVISNHAAAADIPILQNVFYKKIPFLKFFLKHELIYVPLLGLAWWALDFPFMRRFSAQYLAKNPQMKGKDLEATKKACEKFKDYPISVINFVEGTRFTQQKHDKQHSKFKHLLKPKSGGVGFVLGSMGEQINYLIQASLNYSPQAPTAWEYLCGKYDKVEVVVEKIKIPDSLKNRNYITDKSFRKELQLWLNGLWENQDKRLS